MPWAGSFAVYAAQDDTAILPCVNPRTKDILTGILAGATPEERARDLQPRHDPLPPSIPAKDEDSADAVEKRRAFLREQGFTIDQIAGHGEEIAPEELRANIESLIGFARIPIGVMGPLRVNGVNARGDFYVPLATTEGALVASYQRGAKMIGLAGGCSTLCLVESVLRAPGFVFDNLAEAGAFVAHVIGRFEELQKRVSESSRHARLVQIDPLISGKEVYLVFHYTTGDAAGQNMVGKATWAACQWITANHPGPLKFLLSGNIDTDKKHSQMNVLQTRGRRVVAEAVLRKEVLHELVGVTPGELFYNRQISMAGAFLAGSSNNSAHAANALAALFIATGQDAANVAESHAGISYVQVLESGDFYWSITLPALIVASYGGGTALPTQRQCLELLGCYGNGKADKLAEICAAVVLAGDISLAAAAFRGIDWVSAHERLGRNRK